MKILNSDITSLTFSDVVAFCKEGVPEGVEIDYKKDLPDKGLSKFFAAFSNTRGGVLILGVTEDRTTGTPVSWDGIDDNAKIVEQIYQSATNVSPLPNFTVHKTNNENGRVFILVRIFEGENPPYYVQNESNVWVRTGNITNPIELSKPDYLELLFGKREKAEKTRAIYLKRCANVYEGGLKLEEKERLRLIAEAKRKGDGSENHYCQAPLGTNTTLCETVVMPFYPLKQLAKIIEIKNKLGEIRENDSFPNLNMTSMPEGLYYYSHSYTGRLEGQQIYANGLLNALLDVLVIDPQTGRRNLEFYAIAWNAYHVLRAAKKLFVLVGYNGNIYYKTSLNNVEDVWIKGLNANDFFFMDNIKENLLSLYSWERTFPTSLLNSSDDFYNLYVEILKEMYWSFGFDELNKNVVDRFIKDNRITF